MPGRTVSDSQRSAGDYIERGPAPRDLGAIRLAFLSTITVVALAIALGCTRSSSSLPWTDDFSDPQSGWVADSDAAAEVRYVDGAMMIRIVWPDKLSWAAAGRDFADLALSVEASQVSGPDDNEYGILAHMQDRQHFYMFAISGDGYYRVVKRRGSEETPLSGDWTPSSDIRTGVATNHLSLTCQGGTMTMKVNGATLAVVHDDEFGHGDIALYAGTFRDPGDGVEIRFDNLVVTKPATE